MYKNSVISNNKIGGVTVDKNFFNDYFDENDMQDHDDEYEEELEHNNKGNGKTFTKGFITALSICLVAIGAALWTTVNNVNSYLNPEVATYRESDTDRDYSSKTSSDVSYVVEEDAQVNATVSGVKDNKKSEKKSDKVVFTAQPINNKKIIAEYSEVPVYNSTLGDYRAHTGIDYEAEVDDKVRTMGSGVVKDIYYDDMLGTVVVVEHSDEVESYYCGLAQTTFVQMGEVISSGDFVGTVYAIPSETAEQAHVHVAVKEKGKWVNPQKFMKVNEN